MTTATRGLADVRYAAAAIAKGAITSRELVEASVRRYLETEPAIHAFSWFDTERARRLADERDRVGVRGPLHGVPIGVKDIFDTAGIPTEFGSPIYAGRIPRTSSAAVTALDRAGAVIVGKTVTSELAYYGPGATRNPHAPSHTPGGSSQGSAAAVAAGVLPGAVGSQTNGSTIRPAAYCGVVGFKPTGGRISTRGVLRFAPTLDQVGVFANSVADAAVLAAVLAGDRKSREPRRRGPPTLAAVRTSDWDVADAWMRDQFQNAVAYLARAGAPIHWPSLPDGLDLAPQLITVVMAYEAARSIGPTVFKHPNLVSRELLALVERGRSLPPDEYAAALNERDRLIRSFSEWSAPFDAILTLSAGGEAPLADTTGDPRFCSRWTIVGAPAISIPIGRGPSELPLGIQLVSAVNADARLLDAASWVEDAIARGFGRS